MRTVYIDKDGKGCLANTNESPLIPIIKDIARYFRLEFEELYKLILDGEIDFVLRDEECDNLEEMYDRAREELTLNTLNWYINRDLEHYRKRDKSITKSDIMQAYLETAAVMNVNWTNRSIDYNCWDTADFLSDKGFIV